MNFSADFSKYGLANDYYKPKQYSLGRREPSTAPQSFGGRTNLGAPSGGYGGSGEPGGNVDPYFRGINTWSPQQQQPTGRYGPGYGPGAGGIGTAPLSNRRTPLPEFGTLAQRMGSSRLSGGYGGSRSLGAQTSYATPTMPKPTMGAMPTYNAPEIDRGRISELTELGMGAPMGELRSGLNRALVESRYSDNPNVRGLQKKGALSGYGSGIADIRLGAHRTGMSEYMPEFQGAVHKAGAEYQGGLNRMNLQFQADMNEYLKTMKQTSGRGPSSQTGGTFRQPPPYAPWSGAY